MEDVPQIGVVDKGSTYTVYTLYQNYNKVCIYIYMCVCVFKQ